MNGTKELTAALLRILSGRDLAALKEGKIDGFLAHIMPGLVQDEIRRRQIESRNENAFHENSRLEDSLDWYSRENSKLLNDRNALLEQNCRLRVERDEARAQRRDESGRFKK